MFTLADELVISTYRLTERLPDAERYGLRAQIRRAAVSTAANIVEGSARRSTRDYLQFLNIASGSASELRYLVDVSQRLGFVTATEALALEGRARQLVAGLQALIYALQDRP